MVVPTWGSLLCMVGIKKNYLKRFAIKKFEFKKIVRESLSNPVYTDKHAFDKLKLTAF
jgi:hypothetical protein